MTMHKGKQMLLSSINSTNTLYSSLNYQEHSLIIPYIDTYEKDDCKGGIKTAKLSRKDLKKIDNIKIHMKSKCFLFTSNNNYLFTDIATTIQANQCCRAVLKTLGYVFNIHNLPISDMREDKLQEFRI